MRVLRVLGGLDPAFGGPSESAVNQCLATQAAGAQNTVVYPFHPAISDDNELAQQRLEEAGVVTGRFPITRIGGRHSHRWGISASLSRWMVGAIRKYNIVHLHGAWGVTQLAALYVCGASGRPCVMTPHESLTNFDIASSTSVPPWAKRSIRRQYMSGLALVVFSSSAEERDSILPDASTRTVVIPHPVLGIVAGSQAGRREPASALAVGFLGRLHPKKNVDLLIRAVARAPSTRLVIAGDGPAAHRRYLEGVATECAVTHRVEWRGFVKGYARDEFLDSVDLLAMPSAYEGFGMAAAEAMARGVPAMVSSNCGIAEIVRRHGCGVVVDVDMGKWADAIAEFGRDADREALRAASLRAATTELSTEAFGRTMLTEYRRLSEQVL